MLNDQEGRNAAIQRTLQGGLAPNADILKARDSATWLDCQNMVVSNPTGYLSGVSPKDTVTTPPPTAIFGTDFSYNIDDPAVQPLYGCPVFQYTIATFEVTDWPNESWVFSGTGTGSMVNATSGGNQAANLACTASQNCIATGTISPRNLTSPGTSYTTLAIDVHVVNNTHFSSGYLRVGSDSSNYREWTMPALAPNYSILTFDFSNPTSTVGTPSFSSISYVEIGITATSGGSITATFNNLRLCPLSKTYGTSSITARNCNVYNSFILDSTVGTTSQFVSQFGDTLFINYSTIGDGVLGRFYPIKSGYSYSTINGNFYFTQFQKTGSPNNNILYYVNGTDGYFSYDPNGTAGSKGVRINSTNYKYICSHKNMIFLAGASASPNVVQPSDINTPATLTSANAVIVPDKSGSYVTGLISMDEYIAILRNDGIWKLYGSNPDSATTDFNLIRSKAKTGCVEQRAACRVGGFIYYFDGSDIYRWNGDTSELLSEGMDTKLVQYNTKFVSIWYNPLRDLVIFNFVPSTVINPVTTKTTYYQLAYCPSKNAWGEMGAFDDPLSVQFWGLNWGGANYSKPLNFVGGLSYYQIDPTTPTDVSMPWFLQTQWNDANRPDVIKDHDQFTWYFRDQSSRNSPAVKLEMYSDFNPDTVAQTLQAQNEIQTITPSVAPDAGTWTITYSGQTTVSMPFNANAAVIQNRLESLSNIGSGNISVSGTLATTVTLTFQGTLASTDVAAVTATSNLTASGVAVILNVNVIQDGNAYTPTNNSMLVLLNGVSGRSISSKISGTCTSQKDKAVMVSGYSYTWTEIAST